MPCCIILIRSLVTQRETQLFKTVQNFLLCIAHPE